jgi:catechol 2,3-dioxygenase-like lactoylglutathione lyase family enzyme
MHRSRIGIVLIDHPQEQYDACLAFWSEVTGREVVDEGGPFTSLGTLGGTHNLEVQRTGSGTAARIHLDIETDDVPAEVERLVGLGATIQEQREGLTILHDPGGLVFCVVGVQTAPGQFDTHATTWD